MLGSGLLLIAGAVVAATPVTPLPWFEFRDYPMKAFEKKQEGLTRFQLLIAPDGQIADCAITQSSGFEELDKTTCFLVQKRAKFTPARGPDGQAVYGVYRSQAVWALPERTINAPPGPDLEVSLSALPAGTAKPPVVKLAYSVDANGTPTECAAMPDAQKQPQVLVDLGCQELLSKMSGKPVMGPGGQPVPAVKTAAVRFNAGS